MELDGISRVIATLNTHKRLYRPTRLKDGLPPVPDIFQSEMECVVRDIDGIAVALL